MNKAIQMMGFILLINTAYAHADEAKKGGDNADYVEQGRFGLFGGITEDGPHFGGAYETDKMEAILTGDGSFIVPSGKWQQGDMGLQARLGARQNLGTYNYLVEGIEANTSIFGHDQNGNSTFPSYSFGPYISLDRHFSGTNLMLSVFIMPIAYTHMTSSDTTGQSNSVNTIQFFQKGGIGITYLFGK